ncbi:uncharacterized protein C8A04DRAFT_36270 [Dichotomopilus funicola]|uniref:Uncharacterized protein n=1 Tax=Dichotomopilus funicola TaxID=1934379 RepID=A0AAN6V6G7_9PEZI|nr:hypothetical protein C8A04DRAFT_36270 [Dichotomopilus funicola]
MALALSTITSALPSNDIIIPPPKPAPDVLEELFNFTVTGFEAQAVIASDRTYIKFHVVPFEGATSAHCFALGTTATHSLTSFPQTWCHHGGDEEADDSATTSVQDPTHDHLWFSFTLGTDFDPINPTTTDGIWSMSSGSGAYLKVTRQVDAHTRDEAFVHIQDTSLTVLGEGLWAHEVYTGPVNFTMPAFRAKEFGH